jgi:cytochrome c
MKKIISTLFIAGLLVACGSNSSNTKKENVAGDISENPDYKAGLALISKSDCLTCHKVDEKITGPSYRDVANKYASYPDTIVSHLAGKVRKGGNGVWGEIMMLPHSALSQEDAETMVKYILLLKK